MARYTGPKNKLSRREGTDLFGKGVKLRRLSVPPGVHGPKVRSKKMSNYGTQLREKQKVKRMYGLLEKQFRSYVEAALNTQGSTSEALIRLLESRLDNVLFRSGIVPTRAMARQIIVHGHVQVKGIKVDRPSYQVSSGETILLSGKISNNPDVIKLLNDDEAVAASWLKRKAVAISKTREPNLEDVPEKSTLSHIVEYYSR